jgi:Rod binding domain-containing protein
MKLATEGIWLHPEAALQGRTKKDLGKACEGFEAYLLSTMLKELQKTTNLFTKDNTSETYFAMVNEKLAEFIAKKGIGVKEMLLRYTQPGHNTKVLQGTADNTQK